MADRVWKAFLKGREWLGDPPEGLKGVRSPSQRAEGVERPSRRSGRNLKALSGLGSGREVLLHGLE